jgi:hypothetical protein
MQRRYPAGATELTDVDLLGLLDPSARTPPVERSPAFDGYAAVPTSVMPDRRDDGDDDE